MRTTHDAERGMAAPETLGLDTRVEIRKAAVRLLERAVRLNPRDALTRQALLLARAGRRISIDELNRGILLKARRLG